jgi:Flp pilus assembly protein TadG
VTLPEKGQWRFRHAQVSDGAFHPFVRKPLRRQPSRPGERDLRLSAVALTATVGTSMDAAAVHRSATQLQEAADAAALYAVRAATVRNMNDAAVDEATRIFFESSTTRAMRPTTWTRRTSRSTPPSARASRSPVEVTASRVVDLPFGFMRGDQGSVTVSRDATAVEALRTPITLLLLDRTAASAWRAVGTSGLVALEGAAIVNSSSPQALDGSGTADIETTGTLVVGPPSEASNWTPKPSFHASPVNDPYKGKLVWPATSQCAATNLSVKKQAVVLQPGTYCGGIDIGTHGAVTMAPGTYVLTGPLTVTSQGTLTAPKDVTIVLKGESAYTRFQAGSKVTLRAPETGGWKNIAIAQQPQSTEVVSTLIGGAELDMDGVLYFPTQKVVVTGGGAAEVVTGSRILIANRLETSGNGMIYLRGNPSVAAVNLGARLVK